MRTIISIFIFFLFLISMFSLSIKAQVPLEAPQPVTEEEVNRFMEEYRARYVKMDLDGFMALFSDEAVENRVVPYADIRQAYGRFFANSKSMQYNLEIYSIQTYEKSAIVRGRYEVIQTLKRRNEKKVFRGDIQWDVIWEKGSLKIRGINYGRDR